jgi:hypothetical protein
MDQRVSCIFRLIGTVMLCSILPGIYFGPAYCQSATPTFERIDAPCACLQSAAVAIFNASPAEHTHYRHCCCGQA